MSKFVSIISTGAAIAALSVSLATAASAASFEPTASYVVASDSNTGLRGAFQKQTNSLQDYSAVQSGRSSAHQGSER